jgi:hypothetical protein
VGELGGAFADRVVVVEEEGEAAAIHRRGGQKGMRRLDHWEVGGREVGGRGREGWNKKRCVCACVLGQNQAAHKKVRG